MASQGRKRSRSCSDHKAYTSACTACRAAAAEYQRWLTYDWARGVKRKVSPLPSRRRLQALARLGWPIRELAARMGVSANTVWRITHGAHDYAYRSTAARVAALYDELCMTPGPSRAVAVRAQQAGWAPPLAWDEGSIDDPAGRPYRPLDDQGPVVDEVAVARAVAGTPPRRMRVAERREAVRRLTEMGASRAEIARRLGVTPRSVERTRCSIDRAAVTAGRD